MKNIIFFLLAGTILVYCHKQFSPIDRFFDEAEKTINKNNLIAFKQASTDSIRFYFNDPMDDFHLVYRDSSMQKLLNEFFSKAKISNYNEDRIAFLRHAFHYRINNRKFDIQKITFDVKNDYILFEKEEKIRQKLIDFKQDRLMMENDFRCPVGTIVNILLPVQFDGDNKYARYSQNFLKSFDYSMYNDSLKIKGLIIGKEYIVQQLPEKTDTSEIMYKLKILKLSNSRYKIYQNKVAVFDTISFYLGAYGRPLYGYK
jgi:hypothetical protein